MASQPSNASASRDFTNPDCTTDRPGSSSHLHGYIIPTVGSHGVVEKRFGFGCDPNGYRGRTRSNQQGQTQGFSFALEAYGSWTRSCHFHRFTVCKASTPALHDDLFLPPSHSTLLKSHDHVHTKVAIPPARHSLLDGSRQKGPMSTSDDLRVSSSPSGGERRMLGSGLGSVVRNPMAKMSHVQEASSDGCYAPCERGYDHVPCHAGPRVS
jgi:hypothetical protein